MQGVKTSEVKYLQSKENDYKSQFIFKPNTCGFIANLGGVHYVCYIKVSIESKEYFLRIDSLNRRSIFYCKTAIELQNSLEDVMAYFEVAIKG